MKGKKATFYFSNGRKTRALPTDKGINLIHELGRVMQSDEQVISLALMQNADEGAILFFRKEALLGVLLDNAGKSGHGNT
ncbi:MAG: hypothetical protein D6746_14510 [Bacteroidetes bacterium]|nr:MAG: hypothetical protein D6746_14510 [Bacteroidota bacterium]